jgi:5-hydroxyisourate hydrolase
MAGFLTTHVLDMARGCPADGMSIELWRIEATHDARTLLKSVSTNAEGRTDRPLLDGSEFREGIYELVFAVGKYFAARGINDAALPFLDDVPVRFGIADAMAHYHVPLVTSPWAYNTYRGS